MSNLVGGCLLPFTSCLYNQLLIDWPTFKATRSNIFSMAQTNSKTTSFDPITPLPHGERATTSTHERHIRQAFAVDIQLGYELLFRRYYKVLCNQAVRFTYAQDVAEDIVADVFMGFWKNQLHRHITTSYRAYLYQAVRNRVYNHLQNESRRTSQLDKLVELDTVSQALLEDPQKILQSTELYQRLQAEIKRLPAQASVCTESS